MELRDIQLEELKLLKKLDCYCRDHNLRYYLAGGTLLGAVRHKGFIPWDDDIDVLMPRPDFERLLEETNGMLYDQYPLLYAESYKTNVCASMKIINPEIPLEEKLMRHTTQYLWIDIFPMDGMPDEKEEREKHVAMLNQLSYELWQSKSEEHTTGFIKGLIKRIVFRKQIKKGSYYYAAKMNQLAKKYPYEHSRIIAAAVGKYGIKECIEKAHWEERMLMSFEDTQMYVSKGYDEYLTSLFGDYMTIPKEKHTHL